MAGLLSHSLAAMAFSALLGLIFGLSPISYGIFMAGLIAMLIELDLDDLSPNNRTPITHSVLFGIIWVVVFSTLVWTIAISFSLSNTYALELTLAVISAYFTHLLIDAFTKEGIYTFPKGISVKRWIKGLSKGDLVSWGYWLIFQNRKLKKWLRKNDDPILNACVSLPSLLAIIIFVAVM